MTLAVIGYYKQLGQQTTGAVLFRARPSAAEQCQ